MVEQQISLSTISFDQPRPKIKTGIRFLRSMRQSRTLKIRNCALKEVIITKPNQVEDTPVKK